MTVARKRRRTQFDRSPAPIGTIRVRYSEGSKQDKQARVIKVREDGPPSQRWMLYARWLWEQAHGPVTAGRRIAHLDGDMMNDDLSNLAALTPGQVAGLFHHRDPDGSADNYRKCREGTAAFNREQGRARRAAEYLPTQWYAVFPGMHQYQIWNAPQRKRTTVLRACGLDHPWRVIRSAALGYPERDLLQACILVVLQDLGGMAVGAKLVREAVNELRSFAGWARATPNAVASALSTLKGGGLLTGPRTVYLLTGLHEIERERKTPIIVVRGSRLSGRLFQAFRKMDTVEGVCRRCGCVEDRACWDEESGACSWVAPDLCSHCDLAEA